MRSTARHLVRREAPLSDEVIDPSRLLAEERGNRVHAAQHVAGEPVRARGMRRRGLLTVQGFTSGWDGQTKSAPEFGRAKTRPRDRGRAKMPALTDRWRVGTYRLVEKGTRRAPSTKHTDFLCENAGQDRPAP